MLRLIAVAAAIINVAAAWQHIAAHRPRKLTRRNADLYGGQDTQRNEDIEALKRAFYGGGTEDSFRDAAASDGRHIRVGRPSRILPGPARADGLTSWHVHGRAPGAGLVRRPVAAACLSVCRYYSCA